MKTIAIYHKDCTDGTTAAAVVLRKYPDAQVFPMRHSYVPEEMAEVLAKAEPGDRIMTVDCVMGAKEFLTAGFAVMTIDHHAGIEDEYKKIAAENKKFTFVFDNRKSGASLSWATLFPNEPMPELIKYVEDVDLWNWKYGQDSKDVNNYLFMLTDKPRETLKLFDVPLDQMKKDGGIISRYSDIMIDHDVRETESVDVMIGDHKVPFYNITSMKSDCGNILSKTRDCAVGLFTIDGHRLAISFRCLDKHVPSALDLAKVLGGGGHKNAAGAGMPLDQFVKLIVWK